MMSFASCLFMLLRSVVGHFTTHVLLAVQPLTVASYIASAWMEGR